MRRTRHVVLPVRSWQYMGLMIVSLACLTLGLVSRDRGGRSGSLAGPELEHTAPHEVDACPNLHPFTRMSPYDESARQKGSCKSSAHARTFEKRSSSFGHRDQESSMFGEKKTRSEDSRSAIDRSADSRSFRLRTGSSSIRQRRMVVETRRSRIDDRRTRDRSSDRFAYDDNRSSERRLDRIARSRSRDLRSSEHRTDDHDQGRNDFSRSFATSRTDRQENQPLSSLRSRYNSLEREIGDRRIGERIQSRTLKDQLRRTNLSMKRSTNSGRFNERSVERTSTEQRDLSRSMTDLRRSRSKNVDSVGRSRMRESSDERRERESMMRQIERREQSPRSEGIRRKNQVQDADVSARRQRSYVLARSRDSQSSSADRLDRKMSSRLEDTLRRTDTLGNRLNRRQGRLEDRSRTYHSLERSPRSGEPRMFVSTATEQRFWIDSLRRTVRNSRKDESFSVRGSTRRDLSSKQRESIVDSSGRTFSRNSPDQRDNSGVRNERLAFRNSRTSNDRTVGQELRALQERRETSRDRGFGHMARIDSRERNTRSSRTSRTSSSERFETRDVPQERRERFVAATGREFRASNELRGISRMEESRDSSRRDSLQRNIRNSRVSRIVDSERAKRRDTRDISQERRIRLAEDGNRREIRIFNERRQTSGARLFGEASSTDSLQRNIRNSRERRETRDISQERRVRLAEDANRREIRISNERRQTSGTRVFGEASSMDFLQRNIRNSRTSGIANSERQERQERREKRDISQERRVRLAEGTNRREIRKSDERHQTSGARIIDSERRERREARDITQERRVRLAEDANRREIRKSGERRETSGARVFGAASSTDFLQRNIRNSRVSRIVDSERAERRDTRHILQERRVRLAQDVNRREIQKSDERRRTSGARVFADSKRRERPDTRDISQERRVRLAQDANRREIQKSDERRRTSGARVFADLNRRERPDTRDISQERRVRLAQDANRREIQKSDERRRTSGARVFADSNRRERPDTRDISQERRARLTERTQKNSASRFSTLHADRTNSRRDDVTISNEMKRSNSWNNQEIANKHNQMSLLTTMPNLTNKMENEYLRHVILLVLCAIYGASLLKGKGEFYSFRNIVTRANRFVM